MMRTILGGPELFAGELDLDIGEISRRCPELFADRWLLIVTLDSARNLTAVIPELLRRSRKPDWTLAYGEAVLIRPEGVSWSVGPDGLLTHYDELYTVREPPEAVAVIPSYQQDACPFSEGVPREFQEFFTRIGADCYFSDSTPAQSNFCVRSMSDASSLERAEVSARHESEPRP